MEASAFRTTEDMKRLYGEFYDRKKRHDLSHRQVPKTLRHLIPYAELWAEGDDIGRGLLLESAPLLALLDLQMAVKQSDWNLSCWLEKGADLHSLWTEEYTSFSEMRFAFFEGEALLARLNLEYFRDRIRKGMEACTRSAKDMFFLYGDSYSTVARVPIDTQRVPEKILPLVPYAELWGIADQEEREIRVGISPISALYDLLVAMVLLGDELDEWLEDAGRCGFSETNEYKALLSLRRSALIANNVYDASGDK